MYYCGSASDHLGPSAFDKLNWIEQTKRRNKQSHQHNLIHSTAGYNWLHFAWNTLQNK